MMGTGSGPMQQLKSHSRSPSPEDLMPVEEWIMEYHRKKQWNHRGERQVQKTLSNPLVLKWGKDENNVIANVGGINIKLHDKTCPVGEKQRTTII